MSSSDGPIKSKQLFTASMISWINRDDLEDITSSQNGMLERFEKTNHMLSNFNELSQSRLKQATVDFRTHVQDLEDLKKELDNVFRRITTVKKLMERQFPVEYGKAKLKYQLTVDDDAVFESCKDSVVTNN